VKRSGIRRRRRPEEETERIYGPPERRAWMTRQSCVICGARPSVNAHVRTGGTGQKAPYTEIVPMCVQHHNEYDGRTRVGGRKTFLAKYRLTLDDLLKLAAKVEARWLVYAATRRASW
jgi:hypothetical protein